jgi:hypothetical protein
MLGVERVLRADAKAMRVVHAELVNGELPSSNLVERGGLEARRQFPAPFPPYLHGAVVQGHTHRGATARVAVGVRRRGVARGV